MTVEIYLLAAIVVAIIIALKSFEKEDFIEAPLVCGGVCIVFGLLWPFVLVHWIIGQVTGWDD